MVSTLQSKSTSRYFIDKVNKNWPAPIQTLRPGDRDRRSVPKVYLKPVLSGDKVVTDPTFMKELEGLHGDVFAIEMEGAGTAIAAKQRDKDRRLLGVLAVKGISDWSDEDKDDEWQEYAAHAAALFVTELLKSEYIQRILKNDEEKPKQRP